MTKIAVTGATGQVGRELVKLLQKDNIPSRLLVRDLNRVFTLNHPSSEIVEFDFGSPETFAEALKGIESLFLVSSSAPDDRMKSFLEVVSQSKVKEIVVMSGMGAGENEEHFLKKLEVLLKASKIPFVALRANWFYQNFGSHFRSMIKEDHELTFPDGEATLSFVDARDIAEVALQFLIGEKVENNLEYDITGPDSLSHRDVAGLFTKHLPYEVRYRELTEKEAHDELGWSGEWLSLFKDIRDGLTSPVSSSVEKILGKPPRRFEDYIIENISTWAS